jgi:hypothetical protein
MRGTVLAFALEVISPAEIRTVPFPTTTFTATLTHSAYWALSSSCIRLQPTPVLITANERAVFARG